MKAQNTTSQPPAESYAAQSSSPPPRAQDDRLRALVIDDDHQLRAVIVGALESDGWTTTEAASAEDAYTKLNDREWPLVFCDVVLGGEDGFQVLRRFRDEQPGARVVLMTGHGSGSGALDATALGAYDYLLKPFAVDDVLRLAAGVRDRILEMRPEAAGSAARASDNSDIELIGTGQTFVNVMKAVGRVAQSSLPVFLTGESGTGKEVIARALHRRSPRADQPFVAVNCGALPSELIESELFGHVRGAFTGADRDRRGLWEEASGGTIFLDEITETAPAFQVKLLRVLQEGEIRRVGANQTIKVDVRVVAASNRDVEREVAAGRFRQDLLYRLNAVTIHLPPLRERREDIPALATRFVERVHRTGDEPLRISQPAMRLLEDYLWPGNIRELENTVVRAATFSDHTIRPEDLPEHVRNFSAPAPPQPAPAPAPGDDSRLIKKGEWPKMAEIEKRYVSMVLEQTAGNKLAASRILGVDPKTIERMILRHQIRTVKSASVTDAREEKPRS